MQSFMAATVMSDRYPLQGIADNAIAGTNHDTDKDKDMMQFEGVAVSVL